MLSCKARLSDHHSNLKQSVRNQELAAVCVYRKERGLRQTAAERGHCLWRPVLRSSKHVPRLQ